MWTTILFLQLAVLCSCLNLEDQRIRNISWGQLNFIHTTDTHGWLPGHLLEQQYSSDWGDYVSFIHHMRERAEEKGVDILIVDTGDRHDGNGLSDATVPDGALSQKIFMEAPLDIVTIGNHELYHGEITRQEYDTLAPHFNDNYLTSNVDILVDGGWVSVGKRYRQFKTKTLGLNIVAFGFLFNFEGNSKNDTRVTIVEDAVKEPWFQEAIRIPDVDVFVIAGHIPVRFNQEFNTIVKEIRTIYPTVPIQALGGHSHIRDYTILDDYATAIESGRFLETIGWASIDNVKDRDSLEFSRSYIDFNLHSLTVHSETNLDQHDPEYSILLKVFK